MRIEVFDYDKYNAHDFVDFYSFRLTNLYPDSWSQTFTIYGRRNTLVSTAATSMKIRFRVTCDEHWYADDCNTECVSLIGVYTCDSNGNRVCEPGWEGASCDNGTCMVTACM